MNRVTTTYAPGMAWGGGGRGVTAKYEHNTSVDSVRIWAIGTAIGSYPQSPGMYPSGNPHNGAATLFKTTTTDASGHKVVEFKDMSGKLILKKQEAVEGAGFGYTGWLCTYYVYDDFGRLRYIIPPKAVELIRGNWSLANSTLRDGLSFRFEYDGRGRMIIKKLPDAAEQYFVYDKRDRLVFTQTGIQRNAHQWLVTFYDGLDRPYETALYTDANATRQSLQTMMDNADPNYYLPLTYPVPAPEDLTFNSREGNSPAEYVARSSITFLPGFESGVNDTFTAYIDPNAILGVDTLIERYPNDPVPPLSQEDIEPIAFFYYDDYSWPGHQAFIQADLNKTTDGDNPYPEKANPYMNTNDYSTRTRGLATGSRIKVLNSAPEQWLTSTIYYDERGRMIQAIADNVANGQNIVSSKYDFSGKLLSSYIVDHNSHSSITPETRVLTEYKYDDAGRPLTVTKKLNDESTGKIISENTYNALTQLKSKKLGNLETLNYDYNILGWLHGINRWYANGVAGESHFFGMELDYDRGFSQGQYNGNIAGEIWRTSGDGERRAYGFSYDAPSRLTKADFTQYTGGSWNTSAGVNYSTSDLTYDANGNLLTMKQLGLVTTNSTTVDSLHYYYRNGGLSNQLDNVTDNGGTSVVLGDFKDTHSGAGDYAYDLNGNLTKDLNKGISSVVNNHLNLPELIKIPGKGTIEFLYDALGNKLRKIVTDSTVSPVRITTTDYLGGFIYQNDTLQFFPTEEGRVRYVPAHGSTPAAYVYDYFIRDHLGNTRVVLTEQTDFSQYLATMEPQSAQTEEALFSNLESTREARPPDYPSDGLTSPNTSVARLNGRDPGKRVGPSIILKVMAGDTLQAAVRAFYREKPNPRNNTGLPAEEMAGSLLQALALPSAVALQTHAGAPQARLSGTGPGFSGSDLQALKDKDPEARKLDKPKAYLNYVFFDKQLNFVEEGSGVKQLQGDPGQLETLASGKVVARKSGYVYVFTSNESTQDVLFDNLGVTQITGPVLEETHYYPFGLTMAGISSTAPLKLENRFKFNGIELNNKEFNDGSGLDLYTAYYRGLDPQIGRWWQFDPKQKDMVSPYAAMDNNPALYIDFMGDSTVPQSNAHGLKGFLAGEENYIGLPEYTFIAPRLADRYINYDPLYTGALDPMRVIHLSEITSDGKQKKIYKPQYSPFDIVGNITEATELALESTLNSVKGVQKLSNVASGKSSPIIDIGKLKLAKIGRYGKITVEGAGHILGAVAIGITILDITQNDLNWSNGTDLVMGIISYIPYVGWVISGAYFIGNIATEHYTGKTIGEHIGEGLQDPQIQGGLEQLAITPWQ